MRDFKRLQTGMMLGSSESFFMRQYDLFEQTDPPSGISGAPAVDNIMQWCVNHTSEKLLRRASACIELISAMRIVLVLNEFYPPRRT
jgi:hypothetical protein